MNAIEWTDETCGVTRIEDRGGRRIRFYRRRTQGPGKSERRMMASVGLGWCRECSVWLVDVRHGLCRDHRRAEYRNCYAKHRDRMCASKVARKRGVEPVPAAGRESLGCPPEALRE